MIVERFHDTKLAQTSYLLGWGRTGAALVIDPNRDVEQYVRMAEAEGVRITHVSETHIHADFVSGARELAQRTGATLYLSDQQFKRYPDWAFGYEDETEFAGAVLAGQPEPLTYFAAMKRINQEGPRVLHGVRRPEPAGGH